MKKLISILVLITPFIAHAAFSSLNLKLIFKNNSAQNQSISFVKRGYPFFLSCLHFPNQDESFILNSGQEKEVKFTFLTTDPSDHSCSDGMITTFGYDISTTGGAETKFVYNIMREENPVDYNKTDYSVIISNETLPNADTGSVKLDSVKCSNNDGNTNPQEENCLYPDGPFRSTDPQEIITKVDLNT